MDLRGFKIYRQFFRCHDWPMPSLIVSAMLSSPIGQSLEGWLKVAACPLSDASCDWLHAQSRDVWCPQLEPVRSTPTSCGLLRLFQSHRLHFVTNLSLYATFPSYLAGTSRPAPFRWTPMACWSYSSPPWAPGWIQSFTSRTQSRWVWSHPAGTSSTPSKDCYGSGCWSSPTPKVKPSSLYAHWEDYYGHFYAC